MVLLQRIKDHDFLERGGHVVHILNTVLLLLSGMQIAYPSFAVFGTMDHARLVHFVDMYLFLFIGVFHVYQFFATGKFLSAGPLPRNMKTFWGTLKYYLFIQRTEPPHGKYNPLQILTYFLLFVLSAIQVVLGFTLYWPVRLSFIVYAFGGLMTVRMLHLTVAWIFLAFVALHLYLILTQPLRKSASIFTGSYWRTYDPETGEANIVKGPST
jgi:Ni/Fe-hydrogenase 1 B-type cytochrome subunit